MPQDDINVRIITWNMGDSAKKIKKWESELDNWGIISNDTNVDILFITIQEASNAIGLKIAEILKIKMGSNYTFYVESEGSTVTRFFSEDFHVFGYLFIKNDIIKNKITNSMCIYKKKLGIGLCTKPSVGFGIIVSKNNIDRKLIFIGSHFPVNTKDNVNGSYGNNERIEAINTIKKDLITNIQNDLEGVDAIFWAGDMNFRIQTNDNTDQLKNLLETNDDLNGFKEHAFPTFNKTCRLLEYDGTDYLPFVNRRIANSGYDPKRIPSYCDRIIYNGSFISDNYYSWPTPDIADKNKYPLSIAYSDHAPVVLDGKINMQNLVGGYSTIDYKQKYLEFKNKYYKLKMTYTQNLDL